MLDYIDTIISGTRADVVVLAGELRDDGDRLRVKLAVAEAEAREWEKAYRAEVARWNAEMVRRVAR